MQHIVSATLPYKLFVKAPMPTPDREENQACYPHRRHPEGPALAVPLRFHQHLVDTVELPGYLARPAAGSASADGLPWGEEACETLGVWGPGMGGERDQGVQGEPTHPSCIRGYGPRVPAPQMLAKKTGGGRKASGLHTHQRLPQPPWFSPPPLTFSVFTDSVSLVGMLAAGRRQGFSRHAGGAAWPGVGRLQIAASRQSLWEPRRRSSPGGGQYLHGKGVSALVISPQSTPPSPTGGNTIHSDTSQEKKPRGQTESTQCAWPRLILLTSRSALKQLSYSDVFAGPKCYSLESMARPVLHTGILIVTIPKEKSYWMQDRKVPSTKSF